MKSENAKNLSVEVPHPPRDFHAYSVGFCYASVCSSVSLEETLQRLDAEHPTDGGGWKPAEEQFRPNRDYACACEDAPATHKHYLFRREHA